MGSNAASMGSHTHDTSMERARKYMRPWCSHNAFVASTEYVCGGLRALMSLGWLFHEIS